MNCLAQSAPLANGVWLFDLCKLSTKIAVSSSNNQVLLYDTERLSHVATFAKAHDDVITGLVASSAPNEFYSSSRDGTVKLWDARSRKTARVLKAHAGVLSIAIHNSMDRIAIGTELKGPDAIDAGIRSPDAIVSVYDSRSTAPLVSYTDSHAEDVTALSWHPTNNLLLSGGQDGLINVFDTTIVDEEEAVLQVFNHGSSLHLAQFVGKNEVFAISHMESASLYKLSYAQEEIPRDEIKEFGDLRPKLGMDYCVSFVAGAAPKMFTGSSNGKLSIVPFDTLDLDFDTSRKIEMDCGTEIVRSVYLDEAPHSVHGPLLYAAGEDGVLRVFSKSVLLDDETRLARKKERRESKSMRQKDRLRFEPY